MRVELGAGLRDSEAYCSVAFTTAYLTDRNRATENNWSTLTVAQQEAAIRTATRYIDDRWGIRFKGTKKAAFAGRAARAQVIFSGAPVEDEEMTVGEKSYVFVSTLSEFVENQILIGTAAVTAGNLADAVNGNTSEGYSALTLPNASVSAQLQDDGVSVRFTARNSGSEGNDTPLTTVTNVTLTSAFVGGLDAGSQALEFPRAGLYDQSGRSVVGVPDKLKQATAEYAVRAAVNQLFQDPTTDTSGRAIISQKVGPLEVEFAEGADMATLIKPYPAADKLLAEYIGSRGVIR